MWPSLVLLLLAPQDDALRQAERMIREGQFRQALAAIGDQPASVQRHLIAARAHDGLGDAAHAVEQAEAALAIDPKSEAAHLQLGQIFLGHNTPQAAFEIFSEALGIHPDPLLLRVGRGLALRELTRYAEAEADLRACYQRKPDFPPSFDGLAGVYVTTKRFEDLLRLARDYGGRDPRRDYRGPYYEAVALDGLQGDRDQIKLKLLAANGRNARFAASRALLGKVLLQGGEAVLAIPELEAALRLRPDYSPAALHLAQAYQKAGRAGDAARAFQKLREIKEREQTPKPVLEYHRGKR